MAASQNVLDFAALHYLFGPRTPSGAVVLISWSAGASPQLAALLGLQTALKVRAPGDRTHQMGAAYSQSVVEGKKRKSLQRLL